MADITDESEFMLVQLREFFGEFKRGLIWRKIVPRAVNVRLHRAQCERVSHMFSNSTDGRTHLYTALLAAISNNDVSHFNWLLARTEDLLSREEVQPRQGLQYKRPETIDEALVRKISRFCEPSRFDKNDMMASLLQYAVLCCNSVMVENLLPRVQNVSSWSKRWYPFLLEGFSCTALWIAAFRREYRIMSLLLTAGASPYETCRGWQCRTMNYFTRCVITMCKNRVPCCTLFESQRLRKLPISLPCATGLIANGSDRIVKFLKSTFQWNSVVTLDLADLAQVTLDYVNTSGLRSEVLELPCYSEEDILRKQAICIRLVLYTLSWFFMSVDSWDRNDDRLAVAVRDLVRHGASVCGITASTSSTFVAHYQETFPRFATATPNNARSMRRCPVLSNLLLPALLGPCARLHYQRLSTSSDGSGPWDMEYPLEWNHTSPETIGMSYFWIALQGTASLDRPVIRELFNCGSLPHVRSLESVPFSEQDHRIHDGPTCECEGIELSVAQRKMSIINLLLPPSIVRSLQASCRNIIINSCQDHGVVPAIRQLQLPGQMIEYLLYNVSRGNPFFRH